MAGRVRGQQLRLLFDDLEEPDGDDRVDLEGPVAGGRCDGRDERINSWPLGTTTAYDRRLDLSAAKSRVSVAFPENGSRGGRPLCAKDHAVD